MSSTFEKAVMAEAKRLREIYANRDVAYLHLQVTVSGPVDHGDLLVSFHVGSSEYGGENVRANSVEAAMDEYFRRKGWKERHDMLAIPYWESEQPTD